MKYIITSEEFWRLLPYYQELTCGRVRFAKERFDTRFRSEFRTEEFDTKAQALQKIFASPKGTWLIREQEYKPDHWIYEAIVGKTSSGSGDEGD